MDSVTRNSDGRPGPGHCSGRMIGRSRRARARPGLRDASGVTGAVQVAPFESCRLCRPSRAVRVAPSTPCCPSLSRAAESESRRSVGVHKLKSRRPSRAVIAPLGSRRLRRAVRVALSESRRSGLCLRRHPSHTFRVSLAGSPSSLRATHKHQPGGSNVSSFKFWCIHGHQCDRDWGSPLTP